MLTPHCSAASGMVAPLSIASTTRLRKSSEYGFAIHAGLLPVGSLNHIRASMGIPDSAFSGNALEESSLQRSPQLSKYDRPVRCDQVMSEDGDRRVRGTPMTLLLPPGLEFWK